MWLLRVIGGLGISLVAVLIATPALAEGARPVSGRLALGLGIGDSLGVEPNATSLAGRVTRDSTFIRVARSGSWVLFLPSTVLGGLTSVLPRLSWASYRASEVLSCRSRVLSCRSRVLSCRSRVLSCRSRVSSGRSRVSSGQSTFRAFRPLSCVATAALKPQQLGTHTSAPVGQHRL
jgi:hypothetical protein